MKKGYVGALDSLLAMCVFGIALTLMFASQQHSSLPADSTASAMSGDFLDYAYSSGLLFSAMENNTAPLRSNLSAIPLKYCPAIFIYDESGNVTVSVSRPDCQGIGRRRVVAYKVFIYGGSSYVASIASWYQ